MHHLIIALTCLFAFHSVVLGKNKIDLTALEGNYQGHVWNGGDTDPVFTIFRLTADKKLSGSYSIKEEGGIERGTLSEFKWESDYVLVCRWQDRYGEGTLRILFSADLSTFRGFWGTNSETTLFQWDGAKQL